MGIIMKGDAISVMTREQHALEEYEEARLKASVIKFGIEFIAKDWPSKPDENFVVIQAKWLQPWQLELTAPYQLPVTSIKELVQVFISIVHRSVCRFFNP